MDNSGPDEFVIDQLTSPSYARVFPITTFASLIFTDSGGPFVKALSANYSITANISGPNYGWTDSYRYLGYTSNGSFQGQGNKYIGVRFTNGSGEHFGWIQVNVATDTASVTIVDWAYEEDADTSILAGAGAVTQVVPTLNEWGIIVLMTLLAGAAAWKMKQPELLRA